MRGFNRAAVDGMKSFFPASGCISKEGSFVGGSDGLNLPTRIHMVAIASTMVAAATGGVAAGH